MLSAYKLYNYWITTQAPNTFAECGHLLTPGVSERYGNQDDKGNREPLAKLNVWGIYKKK